MLLVVHLKILRVDMGGDEDNDETLLGIQWTPFSEITFHVSFD